MSIRWTFLLLVGLPLAAACGDDTGTGGGSGGQDAGGNGAGGQNTGAGGTNNDGGAGATGGGGAASDGGGGAASDGGGGAASDGGGGAGPMMLNGCTLETAEDLTDEDEVDLDWAFPHQRCIRISTGTAVTWTADGTTFGSHPLAGGATGTVDQNSPIPATNTGTTSSATFANAGEFPYFCTIHNGSMQGVVYVE